MANVVASGAKGDRRGAELALLVGEAPADRLAGGIPVAVEPRIHLGQQRDVNRRQRRAARNGYQRLLAYRFATRLDTALVVALTGSTEAGFDQIVRRARRTGP